MISKCKLTDINENISEAFDLFLCSASFELRCLSVPKSIELSKIKHAVIFYMHDFIQYVNDNKVLLQNRFETNSTCAGLLHGNPLYTADRMKEVLVEHAQCSSVDTILVDITTFTHESLLMLLRLIPMVFPMARITYAYANAKEYDSNNEKDNKWLSKGIGELRSVLGYPGEILPVRKTYLIVIVGYEFERATSIINTIEPNLLALAFGRADNATTEKDKEANEHYLHLVGQMSSSYQDIECFEVKCNDPVETRKIIEAHISKYCDMNIVIVPLNNKISTLGVALAAISNPSIQLSYAPALIYNYTNYSKPGDSCYIIKDMY